MGGSPSRATLTARGRGGDVKGIFLRVGAGALTSVLNNPTWLHPTIKQSLLAAALAP